MYFLGPNTQFDNHHKIGMFMSKAAIETHNVWLHMQDVMSYSEQLL